ncbi:MAG: AAA family ATPase [bacterium]
MNLLADRGFIPSSQKHGGNNKNHLHVENCSEHYDMAQWSISRFKGIPQPTKYLVKDFIPAGIAGTIYSAGGTGKSTLCLDLAIRISISDQVPCLWLGKFPVVNCGSVIYLSAEEPENVLHKRLFELESVIAKQTGYDQEKVHNLASRNLWLINLWGNTKLLFKTTANNLEPTEEYQKLYNTIESMQDIRLVILDTRSRLSGAEGSGNALVSQEVVYYERLASTFGCNVLILHHSNKISYSNNGHPAAAVRGESAFLDAFRFGMYISSFTDDEARKQNIPLDEKPNYLIIQNSKQNYTEIKHPVVLKRYNYEFELTTLNPRLGPEEEKVKQRENDIILVCDLIAESGSMNQTEIIKKLFNKMSKNRVRDALEAGILLGKIKKTKGEHGALYYEII